MIKDLQPRQGSVEIEAEVIEVTPPRVFSKFGKELRVANAVIKDESGTMKLSLWNDQVDKVKVGDKIRIKNGYVNEYQGEAQLTTGKFGTLEVISSSQQPSENKKDDSEDFASEETFDE